jgi:hypothetical protein
VNVDVMAIAGIVAGVVLFMVLVWGVVAVLRTRSAIALDSEHRKLAEEAVAVQRETAEALADLRVRVAAIEKLLRDVE